MDADASGYQELAGVRMKAGEDCCHGLAVPNNPHCRRHRFRTSTFLDQVVSVAAEPRQPVQGPALAHLSFDGPGECGVQPHRPRAAILCLVPSRGCSEVAPVVGAIPRVVRRMGCRTIHC